mgnify:CR=1 FL=1
MTKVLLKDYSRVYQIGNRQLRGGELHELSSKEIKKHKDIILTKIKEEKKSKKKKYTEEQVFDMVKAEQVKIIKKMGLEPARYEKQRVKQILENQ